MPAPVVKRQLIRAVCDPFVAGATRGDSETGS
jgi:hypothetical protein